MRPTLILVHVEDMFRERFHKRLIPSIRKSLMTQEYGESIHFTSHVCDTDPVAEILPYIDTQVQWGWGHDPECFGEEEQEYVIPSYGHEWTWIPFEMRHWAERLRETKVVLGGGCDGECLANMETILSHLDIPYRRRVSFIYS